MLNKRQRFTKPCLPSTWPLLELSSTFKPCNKPDCSNRKRPNIFRVSPKSFRQNSIKNFSKTCTSLSLTSGAVTAKPDNAGKRKSAILTTCSFTLKNAGKNSPSSARKQPSRKPCKTGNHSPYHQGHVRVPFFCVPVRSEEHTSELQSRSD